MYEIELLTEILNRLEILTTQYDLTKNVYTSYQYDRTVFLSTDYDLDIITVKGLVDIDTVRIKGVKTRVFVENFEHKYRNCKVYHAIESKNTVSFLYISSNKRKWEEERPIQDRIMAYVFNTEEMREIGFQKIKLSSRENILERVE